MLAAFRDALQEGAPYVGVRNWLEDGRWSVVECKYWRADVVWTASELLLHGVRDCEGGRGRASPEHSFVVFRDSYEGMLFAPCSSQYRPSVVMPVDYEVGIPEEADY